MRTADPSTEDYSAQLDRVRSGGVLRIDLTQDDPAACGLGPGPREVAALLAEAAKPAGAPSAEVAAAREAVASYLAGHRVSVAPDRIFFAPSRDAARRLALVAGGATTGDEVLVPAPSRPLALPGGPLGIRTRSYALSFAEDWHLDRRSLRKAVGPRTRAVVVGNPAEPSGALLSREELDALEELCAVRGLALVGDEAFLDSATTASVSVARAARCLAVHVSGLGGVCGLPRVGGEWLAVAGPEELAAPAAARLRELGDGPPPIAAAALRALPALLARRQPFQDALRARLAKNRGLIAAASLREAPWTLQWGAGGAWAVLQVNPTRSETDLCLELLADGVAVRPGHLDGLPAAGYLVVSLLAQPDALVAGLDRLERHLRGNA
jgi:aspartate/methionine/tyrosine aminotransferase